MTDMAGIDDPPISKMTTTAVEGEEDSDKEVKPDVPEKGNTWKTYLKNQWISVLLSRNKLIYGFYTGGWYLVQFVGCVAVVNLYSDKDREIVCDTIRDDESIALADKAEKSSDVFDFPLLMLALYHMIEWIRTTVLLTVICIGVNWTWIWYVTTFNTLFGIVVYAIVHMVYMSEDGKSCNDAQEYRGVWLLVEIIAFWALFFCCAFPMVCTVLCGKERVDRQLQEWHDDSGSDSD